MLFSQVAKWSRIHLPMKDAQETDTVWIPGAGKSPGGGNGNPLQYSRLGNPIVRGAWLAIIHGLTNELDISE